MSHREYRNGVAKSLVKERKDEDKKDLFEVLEEEGIEKFKLSEKYRFRYSELYMYSDVKKFRLRFDI